MSSFHTLNLRGSDHTKRDPNLAAIKFRQKSNLKELLVQNFLKKYSRKLQPGAYTTQNSILISKMVQNEIEIFLSNQALTQKNLNSFERYMEKILGEDPRIAPLLLDMDAQKDLEKGYHSRGVSHNIEQNGNNMISQSQANLILPKIQNQYSARIPDSDFKKQNTFQKNRLSQIIKDRNSIQDNGKGTRSNTSPYGLNEKSLQQQQSMRILNPPSIIQATLNHDSSVSGLLSGRANQSSLIINQQTAFAKKQSQSVLPISKHRYSEVSKSYADLKRPYQQNSDEDNDSELPTSIDPGNEWTEIVRYQKELHEEAKQRERIDFAEKKRVIKNSLDHQLRERKEQITLEMEDKKSFDQRILKSIKDRDQIELQKQSEVKQKVYQQKEQRDRQLYEAQSKKHTEHVSQKEQEKSFVTKLKQEILQEKETKISKKIREREQAQKIITENLRQKIIQIQEKEKVKDRENKAIEEYNKLIDVQEQKRQGEWQAREERIQGFMNRMADTVKKSNDAELLVERKVMQFQQEKEEKDRKEEERRKREMRRKHLEVKSQLDIQLQEKKVTKEHESLANDQYMKRWIELTEEENERRKQIEEQKQLKKIEVKDFLLMQMGGELGSTVGGAPSIASYSKRRQVSGGVSLSMNVEEIRLNKQLLKDIRKRKREKILVGDGSLGNDIQSVIDGSDIQ